MKVLKITGLVSGIVVIGAIVAFVVAFMRCELPPF